MLPTLGRSEFGVIKVDRRIYTTQGAISGDPASLKGSLGSCYVPSGGNVDPPFQAPLHPTSSLLGLVAVCGRM